MTPLFLFLFLSLVSPAASSTLAVFLSRSPTVCALSSPSSSLLCHTSSSSTLHLSSLSFSSLSASVSALCGLRSPGHTLLCWNNSSSFFSSPKRLYFNPSSPLLPSSLTLGHPQICALALNTRTLQCWRERGLYNATARFRSVSSGPGFSCGVLAGSGRVECWGRDSETADGISQQFVNETMMSVAVGGKFACGVNGTGYLICRDRGGELGLGFGNGLPFGYSGFALGEDHVCAVRTSNGSVVCSGRDGGREFSSGVTEGVSFEFVVAGFDFTCGLTTANFSVICWGPGWGYYRNLVPLPKILPGPCVETGCDCGIYPQSQLLCGGNGVICKQCVNTFTPNSSSPPTIYYPSRSSPSRGLKKGLLAFAIVGSVGTLSGICTVIYCLWTGVCSGKKKVHNSVQPTIAKSNSNGRVSNSGPLSASATIRRQGSRLMRRQRSGTSGKNADVAEEFTFSELLKATDNFSSENRIGAGSFGVVYRGKLSDDRQVAIKRGNTGQKTKKFQEKETAFDSELAFLSRLHHKHLVRLVGYCEENEERLLVYEFMKNGALHDHLHDKNNVDKTSSVLNSWKMRIKIALDAARGIEYLHNYAVPPIIHRDIKSSNILIDENWTARVSDFGLSLMEQPESNRDFQPIRAAGTVGYIDPEYYSLNVLTGKSDVYGFGVVLLEILTGKRAVFKVNDEEPITLVEFAVPVIMGGGDVVTVLDERVGRAEGREGEAVELVAYTAMHCVNLEGKDRPNMTDIVANLERALGLCEDSHGSISSGAISIASE